VPHKRQPQQHRFREEPFQDLGIGHAQVPEARIPRNDR
jgi:hypothetical protein